MAGLSERKNGLEKKLTSADGIYYPLGYDKLPRLGRKCSTDQACYAKRDPDGHYIFLLSRIAGDNWGYYHGREVHDTGG